MSASKTAVYLDEALVHRLRERAVERGQSPDEVIEEALRRHLGEDVWEEVWRANPDPLPEDEALERAYRELDAVRADRGSVERE
jgi:Arc/MetJ-type ribon-helix-helix transcriptional regulator